MIEFPFVETAREVAETSGLTAGFLTKGSHKILENFASDLENIGSSRNTQEQVWRISEDFPLETILSAGEYERKKGGKGTSVFGKLSSVWEISPIGKPGARRQFRLTGIASTKISLFNEAGDKIACWKMELADPESPGVYLHVQVDGTDTNAFPLPVPRLPTILTTPMLGLEFLLGELFQERWEENVAVDTPHSLFLRTHHRNLFTKTFEWQLETIGASGSTSPWVALKRAQPSPKQFARPA